MCIVTNQCILCINTHNEIIRIFSNRGKELRIAETLADHFWFRVEEFHDQPNGICLECWEKTEEFDKFYKSVQEAHLILLNSKYSENQIKDVVKYEDEIDISDLNGTEHFAQNDNGQMEEFENYGDIKATVMDEIHSTVNQSKTTPIESMQPQIPKLKISGTQVSIVPAKKETNNDEKPYTLYDLEMEAKTADYFQMNCDLCLHHFENWNDARTHYLERHNILKPFLRCCNRKFFLRSRIIDHIVWHVDPTAFQCKKCPKKFSAKRMLNAHMLFHIDDEKRSYECHQCHKRFSRQHILNRHINGVHPIGDQKFVCHTCKKNFKSDHILKMHILKVHECIDQRICDVCAKVFKTKEGFQDHMKTQHMGIEEPRVQCTICGAWLKNRGTLNKHLKIHTDKPQMCDICHKTKPTRTALNHHKRIVHGDASFNCTICEKSFKRQLSLTEHIASHTGENLYTCPYCPKMFKSNSNMHKHRKQVHFDKWTADRESKKNALFSNPQI